jgi:hypothetical protein
VVDGFGCGELGRCLICPPHGQSLSAEKGLLMLAVSKTDPSHAFLWCRLNELTAKIYVRRTRCNPGADHRLCSSIYT